MSNYIGNKIQGWSESSGMDEITFKLAICLFASFPLNALMKRLPDKRVNLKCWYIVTVSAFYLFGVLNIFNGFFTLFLSSMFTYCITRFYRSRFMPYVNFVVVMGHLALNHIDRQFINQADRSQLDITGAQMVLVMKLTSFAWSYYDGSLTDYSKLTEYQKGKAIKSHPSLLNFLAYTFFFPSLLTGPSFDYADFESWLNCEVFRDLPNERKPKHRWTSKDPNKRRQIPKCGVFVLWRVCQGLFWIGLSFAAPLVVSLDTVFKPEFLQKSFLYRIHYLYVLAFTYRLKYYAAWTISEASCILCGLGYNGYDKKTGHIKWDRVQNIDIWSFEMASNTHEGLEAWNMNTNKWLKYYVYLRVAKPGTKPGFRSTLFTFLTSAFWHGTRPGYYLVFATGALYQTCGKFFRRNLRPLFLAADGSPLASKIIYDIVCFYVTKLSFGYLVQPFVVLELPKSLYCWRTVYFYVHLGIAVTFFLFKGPFSKSIIRFLKARHPVNIAARVEKKSFKDAIDSAGSLSDILKAKQDFEVGEVSNSMHLGIPEADFDKSTLDEAKRDFVNFRESYEKWRAEKGLEVEEENLQKAYENFKGNCLLVSQEEPASANIHQSPLQR